MSNRIYETERTLEISAKGEKIEYEITNDGSITVVSELETSWDCQSINFLLKREEAARLKEFLIKHGY